MLKQGVSFDSWTPTIRASRSGTLYLISRTSSCCSAALIV